MRSRNRLLSATASFACALLLAAAPAAHAQDETPAPSPSAFCAVLSPAEIESALGIAVAISDSSETDCTYEADFSSGDFLLVNIRYEDGTLDEQRDFFTDYADVTVGGRDALLAPDATLLFVGLDGGLLTAQLVGSPAEGVDQAAAIQSLVETVLGRLGSVPLPTQEPEPTDFPMPSFEGDADLASQFPTEVAGEPIEVVTFTGTEMAAMGGADTLTQIEEALSAIGRTIDDVSLGFAYSADVTINALRIRGADSTVILQTFLPLLNSDVTDPVQTPVTIAGKSVIQVTDGPVEDGYDARYLYATGDTVWQVVADEPVLSEVLGGLP